GYLTLGDGTETSWQVDLANTTTNTNITVKDIQSHLTTGTSDPVLYPGDGITSPNGVFSLTYNGLTDLYGDEPALLYVDIYSTAMDLDANGTKDPVIWVRTALTGDYVEYQVDGTTHLAKEVWLNATEGNVWYANNTSSAVTAYWKIDAEPYVRLPSGNTVLLNFTKTGTDTGILNVTEPELHSGSRNSIYMEYNASLFSGTGAFGNINANSPYVYYNNEESNNFIVRSEGEPLNRDYYTHYGTYAIGATKMYVQLSIPSTQIFAEYVVGQQGVKAYTPLFIKSFTPSVTSGISTSNPSALKSEIKGDTLYGAMLGVIDNNTLIGGDNAMLCYHIYSPVSAGNFTGLTWDTTYAVLTDGNTEKLVTTITSPAFDGYYAVPAEYKRDSGTSWVLTTLFFNATNNELLTTPYEAVPASLDGAFLLASDSGSPSGGGGGYSAIQVVDGETKIRAGVVNYKDGLPESVYDTTEFIVNTTTGFPQLGWKNSPDGIYQGVSLIGGMSSNQETALLDLSVDNTVNPAPPPPSPSGGGPGGSVMTTPKEICDDGKDNDKDGLVDCNDPDCEGAESCEATEAPSVSRVPQTFSFNFAASQTFTRTMSAGDEASFEFIDEQHMITVDQVTRGGAALTVRSSPIAVFLAPSESTTVDINSDGTDDLSITLNSVQGDKAELAFTGLWAISSDVGGPTGFALLGNMGFRSVLFTMFAAALLAFAYYNPNLLSSTTSLRPRAFALSSAPKPDRVKVTKRMKDMLQTLDQKEREVIDFLIEVNGKTTQAKVHHSTHIPRSTLSKTVSALQSKGILTVEGVGKINKLGLSEWFLRGEREGSETSFN
ncbi:MAG: hypothetical protein ABIG20_01365, partial [archaeon]